MYSPASSTNEFQRPVLHFLVALTTMLAMFPTAGMETSEVTQTSWKYRTISA
jgi:hypothetical protein